MVASRCSRSLWTNVARVALPAALLLGACGRDGGPARIAYPYPWLGSALARAAQEGIDAWGGPRAVEIPQSLLARKGLPPRYAGDIDYAEAMVAVPRLAGAAGPLSSRATLLVAPIYAEHGIPLISPTATSDRVRSLVPWVFQLAPDDSAEGAFLARFAVERLGARRITIFYLDADEYGIDLHDGVVRALAARGIKPVDEVGIIEHSDLPRRVRESLQRAVPDVVIIAARAPEAAAIVRALHERRPTVRVVAGDGVPLNAVFVQAAGPAAAVVYAAAWWSPDLPDPSSRAFAARFTALAGAAPTPTEAMYYDALMVLARAVRDGGPNPAAVRRYLTELGAARPPFPGVTGPIAFQRGRRANLWMTRLGGGVASVVPDTGRLP